MQRNNDYPDDPSLFTIWHRSRTRSFAHHFAAVRLEEEARCEYIREMALVILGILLLVIGLSISDPQLGKLAHQIFAEDYARGGHSNSKVVISIDFFGKLLVLISVIVSVVSLFFSVISKRGELLQMQGRHKTAGRLFMSISQKTRRIESGVFDGAYHRYLIYSLNDHLETILATGENPSDEDYHKAHERMASIIKNKDPAVASAFTPDIPGEKFDFE